MSNALLFCTLADDGARTALALDASVSGPMPARTGVSAK
jgi:hypothetical protein